MENQLQPLQRVRCWASWSPAVAIHFATEGFRGTGGRDKWPGIGALLNSIARLKIRQS